MTSLCYLSQHCTIKINNHINRLIITSIELLLKRRIKILTLCLRGVYRRSVVDFIRHAYIYRFHWANGISLETPVSRTID